jgi:ferritin-like metal-binding protein YciE
MEKMKDLRDLLHHEVMDLASAEEQIIAALPKMIEKAGDPALKTALREHLKVTEEQKKRLDKVHGMLHGGKVPEGEEKGLFGRLFGGGGHKCKGTQGLIEEGEKVMGEDMNPEVMDAAIIACSQKIEHYEICGYGTAKAFALELGLTEVARLLEQTLNEEYEADNRLTAMAVGRLNKEAETADAAGNSGRRGQSSSRGGNTKGAAKVGSAAAKGSKAAPKKASSPAKKSATKGGSKAVSKQTRGGDNNSGRSTGRATSKSDSTKGGSKKTASRGH